MKREMIYFVEPLEIIKIDYLKESKNKKTTEFAQTKEIPQVEENYIEEENSMDSLIQQNKLCFYLVHLLKARQIFYLLLNNT